MLLRIYNTNKNGIAGVENHSDLKIETVLKMGAKQMSFICPVEYGMHIKNEYYIRVLDDWYVVKENAKAKPGYRKIVAELDLEDIKGKAYVNFQTKSGGETARECAGKALAGTGWSCVSYVDDRKRSLTLNNVSAYKVLEVICETFTCEITWSTLTRTVYLKEKVGENRNVYFTSGFNLKELNDQNDSYNYYTRIVPIGADGLGIEAVNNGIPYLENYGYSNKIKTLIWEDTNYKDAESLMADAKYKLNEISKPRKAFSIKVLDMTKLASGYEELSYGVGDTVRIMDVETGVYEEQRIIKMIEYPDNPIKNSCELSNTILTFEEMQKKLFAAANSVNNVTNGNIVIGPKVQGMRASQIKDLEIYSTEALTNTEIENICK